MANALEVTNLSKAYGKKQVLLVIITAFLSMEIKSLLALVGACSLRIPRQMPKRSKSGAHNRAKMLLGISMKKLDITIG